MFTYFRAISLFILLTATGALGASSQVDGPSDIFGGGGVTEGSDVGFDNLTAHRIKATSATFTNLSVKTRLEGPGSGGNRFYVDSSGIASANYITSATGLIVMGTNPLIVSTANNTTVGLQNKSYSVADVGVDVFVSGSITNSSGNFDGLQVSPAYNQSGTAGRNTLFINVTSLADGSGEKNLIKGSVDNAVKFRVGEDGASYNAGGIYTAFRNISSATATLTSADYFINCLANDNLVTLTLPAISASYSQTLMVKYTDSGSTNKCKLDGNGAEQVEGFDVYSGLDTYKEGVILKSDGAAWWITGGL